MLYDAVLELAASRPEDVTSPLAAAADVDPRLFDIGWKLVGLENVIPAAGVAWHLTGDNAYLDNAVGLLEEALSWPRWSDGRHEVIDGYYDVAPETASGIRAFAWALDFFDGALPEELTKIIRKRLAYMAQRLTEISASKATRWAANDFDDWSTTMHSAIGQVAMVLLGIDDRAESWLERAISRITAYLEALPTDGSHPSGIARWEFALTHVCTFFEALYRVTGRDLRQHEAIKRTRRFAIYCLAPGGTHITQMDQALPLSISNIPRGPLSKLLARWFQDPVIRWGMANTPRTGYIQAQDLLWYEDSGEITSPEAENIGSMNFRKIGWMIMRSGWSETDNLVTFKSSPYWPGYHHLDQNSFEIIGHGCELALDSGLGWRAHPNYFERYRDSLAHNVILINGKGQHRHTAETSGKMLKSRISGDADYAAGDSANAYDDATKVLRAILFLKPNVIVVRDVVELVRPLPIQWQLHGSDALTIHPGSHDRGFSIKCSEAALQAFVVQPKDWSHTQRRAYKLSDWKTRHENTHPVLSITPDKSGRYEFLVLFIIQKPDEPREFPGRVLDDGSLSLMVKGTRWIVKPTPDGLDYRRCK